MNRPTALVVLGALLAAISASALFLMCTPKGHETRNGGRHAPDNSTPAGSVRSRSQRVEDPRSGGQRSPAIPEPGPDANAAPPAFDDLRGKLDERKAQRLADLKERFGNDAVNPVWARAEEDRLRVGFQSRVDGKMTRVLSIQCRTNICVTEAEHIDENAARSFGAAFFPSGDASEFLWDGPRHHSRTTDATGRIRETVFLGRRGYTLLDRLPR